MSLLDEESKYLLPVYRRLPLVVIKGNGSYLYDENGTCYLDLLSGIGVTSLGHNHPGVVKAIEQQLKRNLHLCNYFVQDVQVELAKKLVQLTGLSHVFFTNSGTEAMEGILKLVKKWGLKHGKSELFSLEGSFHGRSIGALSLTAQEKYQKNFRPLLSHIQHLPFNDVDALEANINDQTAAFFLEPIKGEGGIRPVSNLFVEKLLDLKSKYGFLIVVDEIQSGVGRTGKFYAYENFGLKPDIIATAKALGGGLPLGAFIVNEELSKVLDLGEHGTTFGGNPLSCAAGLATVNTISEPDFLIKINRLSNQFVSRLYDLKDEFGEHIVEIRGIGLMLGLEVKDKGAELVKAGLKAGMITNVTAGNTLRFLPPLNITKEQIEEAYQKLRQCFKAVYIT